MTPTVVLIRNSLVVFVTAYILNIVWEFSHTVLYNWPAYVPPQTFVAIHVHASFVDACIVLALLWGGMILFRSASWWMRPSIQQIVLLLFAGFCVSVWIEYRAVFLTHAWGYGHLMPTLFDIGLTPIMQMLITPIASFWIAGKLVSPKKLMDPS